MFLPFSVLYVSHSVSFPEGQASKIGLNQGYGKEED